jgi:hypothetical protein
MSVKVIKCGHRWILGHDPKWSVQTSSLEESSYLFPVKELLKLHEGNIAWRPATPIFLEHMEDWHKHLNLPGQAESILLQGKKRMVGGLK